MTGFRPGPARRRIPAPALAALAALTLTAGRGAVGQEAPAGFFRSDEALVLTLRTDLRRLLRDRDTADAPWRDASLTWAGPAGPATVPLRVRTRGLFRLRHCDFPPVRLRFSGDSVRGTPFEGLRRPKLGTHCMDRDEYEQYLLQEYAINRVWALFTPVGHAVRLVRVTYEDTAGAVRPVTRYAFLSEDPQRLAERLGGTLLEQPGIRMGQLHPGHTALVGLFQYFIANTDWSVPGLHNVELLTARDTMWAIPYDFDWAGAIAARYARPAELLPIRTVRERIYRGLCQPLESLEPALARFEALRDSIAAVYRGVPGLDPRIVERTLRYYGEFYREIADRPRFVRYVVERDCMR